MSYSKKNGANVILNYIVSLLKEDIAERDFCLNRWSIWQHFFKPYSFHKEKEVRLLFIRDNVNNNEVTRKWVNADDKHFPVITFQLNEKSKSNDLTYKYPCLIKEIKLGPLFPKKEDVKLILKKQLDEINENDIKVSISRITELQ